MAVHQRDGWEALGALLPPAQKRGLVLIDPPYEAPGEFGRVLAGLRTASARFGPRSLAAWYPIKHRSPVTTFLEGVRLAGLRDVRGGRTLAAGADRPARLNGCGLLVRNPPAGSGGGGGRSWPRCWSVWATPRPAQGARSCG